MDAGCTGGWPSRGRSSVGPASAAEALVRTGTPRSCYWRKAQNLRGSGGGAPRGNGRIPRAWDEPNRLVRGTRAEPVRSVPVRAYLLLAPPLCGFERKRLTASLQTNPCRARATSHGSADADGKVG